MVVPSTGKENDYSWLCRFPKMREWICDKVVKALAAFNYTIRNKDWEATVEVERNDIEDDQIMGYALQAKGAGQSAAELPADIVFALLSKGFTNLCYDGQPFFDTDHLSGGKSVSNKGTKKLAVTSLAAAKARGTDVIICDTAGRLQTKKNLMAELSKMYKVIDREYPQAARETLLVLDAT